MANTGSISVTRNSPDEILVEWKIDIFTLLNETSKNKYRSDVFSFVHVDWCLRIHLDNENTCKNTISISTMFYCDRKQSMSYVLSLKNVDGKQEFEYRGSRDFAADSSDIVHGFPSRSELMSRKEKNFSSDICTVRCTLFNLNYPDEVGQISIIHDTTDEMSLDWKIPNYSLLNETKSKFCSPGFKFSSSYWYLHIAFSRTGNEFLKVENTAKLLNRILMKEYGRKMSVNYIISFIDLNGSPEYTVRDERQFRACCDFIYIQEGLDIQHRKSELLPSDVLTVRCTLRLVESQLLREDLVHDIRKLLISGKGSDVILKVKGREFQAHRLILQIQLPEFCAKFQNDLQKKPRGMVVVEDSDPDTYMDFLHFLYAGYVADFSTEKAMHLYTTAHEHQQLALKEICLEHLKSHVSVENFVTIMTLALRHKETELSDIATEFFMKKGFEIISTPDWKTFLHRYLDIGHELTLKYIKEIKEK